MKTILVSGGAGFIGSHIADLAIEHGFLVTVLDNLSTGRPENVPTGAQFHQVDITDESAVRHATDSLVGVAAVIHCAAQASVVASLQDPELNNRINVDGTAAMLNVAATHECPLVFTSTAGVYGDYPDRPIPETAPLDPLSPYAESKAAGERLIQTHANERGLDHAICRLANVYGPRQRGDGEAGVVAVLASKIAGSEPITLFGHGLPTRDFVHVEDVARGLFSAIGRRGVYNIATGIETSVQEVFDLACDALEKRMVPTLADLRSGEIMNSSLNPSHAHCELDWVAQVPIQSGIPSTVRVLVA